MGRHLSARFVALYLLLGAVTLAAVLGAAAFATMQPLKHQVAQVKRQLSADGIGAKGCAFVASYVQPYGLTQLACKVTGVTVNGDTAKVTLTSKLTDGTQTQTLRLVVTFERGVWTAAGIAKA